MVARSVPRLGLVALLLVAATCGGSSASDAGDADRASADDSADSDGTGTDADPDGTEGGDGSADGDTDVPPQPACGNGIFEDGEECDDGNRLDGDECDWTCRFGAGEPPGPPDPAATPLEPRGEVAPLEGIVPEDLYGPRGAPIPLVWNGSCLALVVYEAADHTSVTARVRFHRFLPDGTAVGPDWFYEADEWHFGWLDLVWTGTGYGLFFFRSDMGACLQRLEVDGKPLGAPIVIVPGAESGSLADRTGADYFALYRGGSGLLEIGRFADDGTALGPGLALAEYCEGLSDITARPTGIAAFGDCWDSGSGGPDATKAGLHTVSPDGRRIIRREWIDSETRVQGGTTGRTDDGFFAAWERSWIGMTSRVFCVARFGPEGQLLRAPGCAELPAEWHGTPLPAALRAGRDAHGLALAFSGNDSDPALGCDDHALLLRTDGDGRAVGEPIHVLGPDVGGTIDSHNVVWVGDSYVVLTRVLECSRGDVVGYPAGLYVRRFVPGSP